MFHKQMVTLLSVMMLLLLACKPLGSGESEVMTNSTTTDSLDWFARGTPREVYSYQKSKVKLWWATMVYGETAPPEAPKVAAKSFWSLSKYYMDWRYRKNLKLFDEIVAGKKPDLGGQPSGFSAIMADRFGIDAAGLHFSTSKGIRKALRRAKAAGDAATDKLVNADEVKAGSTNPLWWDKFLNPKTPLTAAEKKFQTADNHSKAQALKENSPYYKKDTNSFNFKTAYTNFKKAEKMSMATNVEATVDRGSGKITAWVGGKILGKSLNQSPHFLEAWLKVGVDEAVVTASPNTKPSAMAPAPTPIGKGFSGGVTFFGQNSTMTPISNGLKNLMPAIPKIPAAKIPVFVFPGGSIVVSFALNPLINIMADINVRKAGMVTLTAIPVVGMTFTAKVGAELAVIGLGVKGDLTVFHFKVPMSLSIGGSKSNGLYYAGTLIAGPVLSMFGGSALSLYGELALPTPFNYVVWAATAIAKAVTGLSLSSELGLDSQHLTVGFPIWAPEGMLTLWEGITLEGPSYIPNLKGANCTALHSNIEAHKREAKRQPKPMDPIFVKVNDNVNKMINLMEKAIEKECGIAASTTAK
ncbi:MAG: hypothetical protein H7249_12705 [Chitinophagaceae bacterium]|nr:hypothetical protein [Oligoflexus sp.]